MTLKEAKALGFTKKGVRRAGSLYAQYGHTSFAKSPTASGSKLHEMNISWTCCKKGMKPQDKVTQVTGTPSN